MKLDVVILPPKNIRKASADLSLAVKKSFPVNWRVDNKKLIPHVSLYHLEVPQARIKKLIAELEKLLKNQKKLKLVFPGVRGRNFFSIDIVNDPKLFTLHKKTVLWLKKYRNGIIKGPLGVKMDGKNNDLLKNFGSPMVLRNFWPHMTLGMLKNPNDMAAVISLAGKKLKAKGFVASTVALTQVDPRWQVIKIIKEFKLK